MAWPGELAVYHTFPAPFATQQGALVGYAGAGPTIGDTLPLEFTIAKLSGLCAGVKPRMSFQNAAPSGVLFAVLGSVRALLVPVSAPCWLSGSCSTDPDVIVSAAQSVPTAICAAEESLRLTTVPSKFPFGHAWLSAQFVPATKSCSLVSATESGFAHPGASLIVRRTLIESPRRHVVVPPHLERIAAPRHLSHAIGTVVGHRAQIALELKTSRVPARAAV